MERLWPLRIGMRDASHDVLDFPRWADCVAGQASRHTIEVFAPRAPNDRQGRREVELYLASWKAANPSIDAEVVD